MDPTTRFGAQEDGFQILLEDGDNRVFCRGASAAHGDRTVLAVLPASEHPARATLDRLAREYGLKDELDGTWAPETIAGALAYLAPEQTGRVNRSIDQAFDAPRGRPGHAHRRSTD